MSAGKGERVWELMVQQTQKYVYRQTSMLYTSFGVAMVAVRVSSSSKYTFASEVHGSSLAEDQ